uniref:Uncharacterized protein n=1 Tax=Colletotrichum fructicola (strain Nara gc5) TaxID=1213859 RepID=L2G3Y4_COLFN
MKFSAATILAVVGLVAAQLDGIPSPANYQAIVTAGTPCVLASCGAEVAANQVLPAAGKICAAVAGAASITSRISQASASASATRTVVVTSAVTSRNGTSTATSTVAPVTVNGANVQGPVGVLAMLAVGALAAL